MVTSKFGTVTPKHFKPMVAQEASEVLPSGVYLGKRVELRTLFPQLGSAPLSVYYLLRIACCGYMLEGYEGKRENCNVCRDNHGFVCPACLGHGMVKDERYGLMVCTGCCYEYVGEKSKIMSEYDPQRELQTVQRWLARKFPYGVPHEPTDVDLAMMDRF